MSFPAKVIEGALIASARHCCVCKQYKGVKVEIHHIIPIEKGGEDNFDNAIVLCFDCHADAGHYYAKHPKGKKFSPEELRKHRDVWYENVKINKIPVYDEDELVHCRYYITKNPSLVKEITEGNFSRFPVKNILVHNNDILKFQKGIINNYDPEPTVFYDENKNAEKKYLLKHPDAKKVDNINYPYYSYTRIPKKEDVINTCGNMEICKFLLSTGEDINNFFKLLAFLEPCGMTFQEQLQIRFVWACYLCITNTSNKYLRINSINYNGSLVDNSWETFSSLENMAEGDMQLPGSKLSPNESIVIPILTLLAPFDDNNITKEISSTNEVFNNTNEVIETTHLKLNKLEDNSKFNVLGPGIIPNKICLTYNGSSIEQNVHRFNFSNMFIYDRYFMCGCCPYVFFSKNNNLEYYGEVFLKEPGELQMFKIVTPSHVDTFFLSELEYEKTFILDIKINKKSIISNKLINKGESIKFKVKGGDIIEGIGCYYLNYESADKPSPMQKNNLIRRYMLERI